MDTKSTNNTINIELSFRGEVKRYRALLRWGVDKVFHDSNIDSLFNEVRTLIDKQENQEATNLLIELKKQINSLEERYPKQKSIIEKKLFEKIALLETTIDTRPNIKPDQTHEYLQTLEIARVAIQNDDWTEAKNKITIVEKDLLLKEKITAKKESKPKAEQRSKPQKSAKPNSNPFPSPLGTHSLGKISRSLFSTASKSCVGKIVNYSDLLKTFTTIDKSFTKNIRISFLAKASVLNNELSSLSKRTITLKDTGSQMILLRLAISRELTIYLIGIPINENVSSEQIEHISLQTSSLFIDIQGIDEKKPSNKKPTASLIKTLADIKEKKQTIFIKANKDSSFRESILADESFADSIDTLFIDDNQKRFIENIALRLDQFANIEGLK